jgi:hypothetical protein
VADYIAEVVKHRINTLTPFLALIREGFFANLGIDHHPLISGTVISRMCQGGGEIKVDRLRELTTYQGFDGDADHPSIRIYWRAVERLTSEQRKLLLKFITTSTRLPNTAIVKDFKIQMDAQGNVTQLPTASTCFNRLHWPRYTEAEDAYRKLVIAIEYCQSMELA